MAAALGAAGVHAASCACDRPVATRSESFRQTSAVLLPPVSPSHRVRAAAPTCSACTASGDADGSRVPAGLQSSSQCRAGPTGNSGPTGSSHRPLSGSISGGMDRDLQSLQAPANRVPAATSEAVGTVVICGWLGSNKRFLKRYQDWWIANSWDPVIFLMPVRGALTLGSAAQELVEGLITQLANRQSAWRNPKEWRLLFHCFSNTGWYTFGAVMEGLLSKSAAMMQHVVGSVVDSAPHAQPCAKVWASGFTSALLPRRDLTNEFRVNVHAWMEAFFEQWLKGTAGDRLKQLAAVLQQYQTFPQLYIYSESDHVVPHTSVEAFMESQSRLGRMVSGMRFQTSPHVDHFRSNTLAYTEGLKKFVADALAFRDPQRPEQSVMTHLHPYMCMPLAA